MDIRDLPLAAVRADERLRPVNQTKVIELAHSIEAHGQIVPIEVFGPGADGLYGLISGAHRLAACQAAGVPTVAANVLAADLDEETRMLREIDENLYRNELSPYDFTVFLARRADIWERLNGKIKRGGGKGASCTFSKDTAERLGISADAVKRARRRLKLGQQNPSLWAALRGTIIAETGAYLDAFLGLDAEKQAKLLEAVRFDGLPFMDAYKLAHGVSPTRPKTQQQQLDALLRAWEAAEEPARREFRKIVNKKPVAIAAE